MPSHKYKISFESFGVKIGVAANVPEALEAIEGRLEAALPGCHRSIPDGNTDFQFSINWNTSGQGSLFLGGKRLHRRVGRDEALRSLVSTIRLTVAENAVDHVFVHAGVAAWYGRAIVIPGKSYSGKTTLTLELVKRGATYYSDEYAIIDRAGLVHPFLKDISLRLTDDVQQTEYSVEEFNGTKADGPVRAGLVLFTKFHRNARWKPERLSRANGILELIKDVVPIRRDPKFVMDVLNSLAADVKFIRSKRSEATAVVEEIVELSEAAD